MKLFLLIVACCAIAFLPSEANGDLIIQPLKWEWDDAKESPWSIQIPGCNLAKIPEELEFRFVRRENPLGGIYYGLESLYSDFPHFYITIEDCPVQAKEGLKFIEGEGFAQYRIYFLIQNLPIRIWVWEKVGRKSVVLQIKLSVRFSVNSGEDAGYGERSIKRQKGDREMDLVIANKTPVALKGLMDWYTLGHFPASPDEIRALVINIETSEYPTMK